MPLDLYDVASPGTAKGGDRFKEGDIIETEIDGVVTVRKKVSEESSH